MALAELPTVRAAMATDQGKVRKENQDACLVAAEKGLFILADGMGGHQAGEVASRIVVNVLPALLERELSRSPEGSGEDLRPKLRLAAVELSAELRREAEKRPGLSGMGATVVLALLRHRSAHILHLGDSRAYLFRRGRLRQLTQDHTLAAMLLRMKEITAEQARAHPGKSRLSRYVGMEGEARPDVQTLELEAGDRLLLCSDGLTGMVPDPAIAQTLRQQRAPEDACRALVAAANAAGGRDNISVVIVDVDAVARETKRARSARSD